MLNSVFQGIFDSAGTTVISVPDFLLCIFVSLLCGILFAGVHAYRSHYTRSFLLTLAMLPAVVCVVIMMVNGNVGAGVAVAGAFSLVRFRSAPGTAREISHIFMAMGAGLISGMGYLGYAVLFTVLLSAIELLLLRFGFGKSRKESCDRTLRITIPEDLDYTEIFEDLFETYTCDRETVSVKTVNMGSLFRLTYHITLKDAKQEKTFIDALRERNGNLEISMSRQEEPGYEL